MTPLTYMNKDMKKSPRCVIINHLMFWISNSVSHLSVLMLQISILFLQVLPATLYWESVDAQTKICSCWSLTQSLKQGQS